uniref:Uncharacterized protein n=1 Tax=Cyprinodon variegatus TaxID=28743 RepID=A0A3Q2ED69_CYPVA
MLLSVCRYRSWRADGASAITREASFRALEAFISPSPLTAALTLALASRLASASAAMALCSLASAAFYSCFLCLCFCLLEPQSASADGRSH